MPQPRFKGISCSVAGERVTFEVSRKAGRERPPGCRETLETRAFPTKDRLFPHNPGWCHTKWRVTLRALGKSFGLLRIRSAGRGRPVCFHGQIGKPRASAMVAFFRFDTLVGSEGAADIHRNAVSPVGKTKRHSQGRESIVSADTPCRFMSHRRDSSRIAAISGPIFLRLAANRRSFNRIRQRTDVLTRYIV